MKFGQLIEHRMINIFLEKSYTKCGGKTSPRHFSEKVKSEHVTRSIVCLFLLYGKLKAIEIY